MIGRKCIECKTTGQYLLSILEKPTDKENVLADLQYKTMAATIEEGSLLIIMKASHTAGWNQFFGSHVHT